jgi:hypothetical protein
VQVPVPFGTNVGGVNVALFQVNPLAQFDSWVTVGETRGNANNDVSSIGIDFTTWSDTVALVSATDSGGAVYWLDPDKATAAVSAQRTMVVAQLTLRDAASQFTSQTVHFDAQGRSTGHPIGTHSAAAAGPPDWEENCIEVLVGGSQNGQGSHSVLSAANAATGQGTPPTPPAAESSSGDMTEHGIQLPTEQGCSFEQFPARIEALNAECCPANLAGSGSDPCAVGMPTSCSLDCGAGLFPLLETCQSMIDLVFDGGDGSLDGVASQFALLADQCRAVGGPAVLDRIRELKNAGCVVHTNGVGETLVEEQQGLTCADENPSCTMAVQAGLLSCLSDLCPDPSCSHASQCDLTCGFCHDG